MVGPVFTDIDNEQPAKNFSELKNDEDLKDRQSHRDMRDEVKKKAFRVLYVELIFLGIIIILQGFGKYSEFSLNQWVFGIITSGVIIQTFAIVKVIAVNLFPNKK